MTSTTLHKPFAIVVLISGRGSNLQSIIDAVADHDIPVQISAVISNVADAYGLERAREAGIPVRILEYKGFEGREDYDTALMELIDEYQPGLVVLAGFMRILTPSLVAHYSGQLINIHPSLLPAFRGLHTHQRALAEGASEHGASVHFVTEDLDAGAIILQARVPVLAGDDADTLAARVLEQEHVIYPRVIGWFAQQRLALQNDQVVMDGQVLDAPLTLEPEQALQA